MASLKQNKKMNLLEKCIAASVSTCKNCSRENTEECKNSCSIGHKFQSGMYWKSKVKDGKPETK